MIIGNKGVLPRRPYARAHAQHKRKQTQKDLKKKYAAEIEQRDENVTVELLPPARYTRVWMGLFP